MHKLSSCRWGGVFFLYILFVAFSFTTRLALLTHSWGDVDRNFLKLVAVFGGGLFFDVVTASYFSVPLIAYVLLVPQLWFVQRGQRIIFAILFFALFYLFLFAAVAEWIFWDEFGTRFNFIAVDYLVYTHEVIGNIKESYPLPLILGGIFVVTALLYYGWWNMGWMHLWFHSEMGFRQRLKTGFGLLVLPVVFAMTVNNRWVPNFSNTYNYDSAEEPSL